MSHPLANGLLAFFVLGPMVARAEPPLAERIRPEPGHLVPVDPYRPEQLQQYIQLCNKLLRVVEFEKVRLFETHKHGTVIMVYRPSFEPEACIALREKDGAREYELNYTQANHNIYFSMPDNGKKGQAIAIKIAKSVKPLDRDRAQRVYNIWARMLRGVRYPEEGPRAGCPDDGETIEFRYAWKGMYGETCSPSRGSPKMLADLGNSLILFCKTQGDQSKNALILVDKNCEELENFLDAEDNSKEARK